ncbi:MAG: hypothetical protein LBI42_01435 [Chitinispirillales bacterium]|nr:hypothetical protein [Chitinispirillales bacterium]
MVEFSAKEGHIELILKAVMMGNDLCLLLTGGASHIGAVCVGSECMANVAFPYHRENYLNHDLSEILRKKWNANYVIVSGIHFDEITKEEIDLVRKMAVSLIEQVLISEMILTNDKSGTDITL